MSELLSNDQIAALVEAAREGKSDASLKRQRRARRVREIDFTRPTKFTQEQQRRFERGHDSFCRGAATQLSAELRSAVELEVLNVGQHTWAAALDDVPQPSLYGIVEAQPLGSKLLVTAEMPAVRRLLTRLLGGADPGRYDERTLSEIDLMLARRIVTTLLHSLSVTWHDLLGIELQLVAIETQPQAIQLAPPSEPVLALTLELHEEWASSTLSLIVPHRSIEPVVDRLSGGFHYGDAAGGQDADPLEAEAVHASLAEAEVEVRAEVAAVELTIDEVLALGEGDIVTFRAPAANGLTLYVDNVPVHRVNPGRSGSRSAVQVIERLDAPV